MIENPEIAAVQRDYGLALFSLSAALLMEGSTAPTDFHRGLPVAKVRDLRECDAPGYRRQPITNLTMWIADGRLVLDGDDISFDFTGGSSAPVTLLALIRTDGWEPTLWRLIDQATPIGMGLPFRPSGQMYSIVWDNGPNRIASIPLALAARWVDR